MVGFANIGEALYSRDWIFPIGIINADVKANISIDAFLRPFVEELKQLAVLPGMHGDMSLIASVDLCMLLNVFARFHHMKLSVYVCTAC